MEVYDPIIYQALEGHEGDAPTPFEDHVGDGNATLMPRPTAGHTNNNAAKVFDGTPVNKLNAEKLKNHHPSTNQLQKATVFNPFQVLEGLADDEANLDHGVGTESSLFSPEPGNTNAQADPLLHPAADGEECESETAPNRSNQEAPKEHIKKAKSLRVKADGEKLKYTVAIGKGQGNDQQGGSSCCTETSSTGGSKPATAPQDVGKNEPASKVFISLPITHDIMSLPGIPPALDDDIVKVHMGFAEIPHLTGKGRIQSSGDQPKVSPTDDASSNVVDQLEKITGPSCAATPGAATTQSYAQMVKKSAPTSSLPLPAEPKGMKHPIIHLVLTIPRCQSPNVAKRQGKKGIAIRSGKIKTRSTRHRSTSSDYLHYDNYDDEFEI